MNEKMYETGFQAPEGLRIYAIGDIHGGLDLLKKMHSAISADLIKSPPQDVHIVYLGDYVDRGEHSQGVIDTLIARRDRGDGVAKTFLLGNHEQGMIDFIEKPDSPNGSIWLDWGGMETLASYGITFDSDVLLPAEKEQAAHDLASVIPQAHMEFLKSLSHSLELGEYFFAHAGVDPIKSMNKQDIQDLYFIREPFLSWPEPLSHMVVHGHTKTTGKPEILPHRINVDTGIYETGILTAAVIESDGVRFLSVD